MNPLLAYMLGALTPVALLFGYAVALSVRKSWGDPVARNGYAALAFLLVLLAVVFLLGMNFAAWWRGG